MLFPAYAGVILGMYPASRSNLTFPRIRGGDPICGAEGESSFSFSLHTQG